MMPDFKLLIDIAQAFGWPLLGIWMIFESRYSRKVFQDHLYYFHTRDGNRERNGENQKSSL
jgi:hypothetical protein